MILALDQSTAALGFCTMTEQGQILSAGSQRFRGARAADRVPLIVAFMRAMLGQLAEGSVVALERSWLGKNAHTVDQLAELRGRLAGMAEAMGHDVRLVHPAEWRAWFEIRANTPRKIAKQIALGFASRLIPIVDEDDDMAEAVCLAEYVRGVLQRESVERRVRAS